MANNKNSKKDEPKNVNHGQIEQNRIEGKGGKGVKAPTREHTQEGVKRSKGKGGMAVPDTPEENRRDDAAMKPKKKAA